MRETINAHKCRLRVGTCGYSYAEWIDAGFYPAGTPSAKMLSMYTKAFVTTELNYTWYQMPKPAAVERMCEQVPEGFVFAAKLNRMLTHEIDSNQWRGNLAQYRDGISPLIQAKKLAALLVQFPPSFRRSVDNRVYLAKLLDALEPMPVAVEFRHVSWAADKVFDEFKRRKVTLVTVDVPDLPGLFPCVDVVTNPDLFYIRFHGRNAKGWRSGNMQKQFDYDYTEQELQEWTDKRIINMVDQARNGLLFFNNHVRAQAPRNALSLVARLVDQGLLFR